MIIKGRNSSLQAVTADKNAFHMKFKSETSRELTFPKIS